MASSTWLDGDTAKRADALKFQSDTDSDLWSLAFHLNSESSLAHLDSLVEQPAPRPSHAAMPTTPELPDPAERQQWQSVQQPDLQPQQWRSAQPEQNASGQELYSPEERYGQPRPVEMAPIAAEQSFDTQPATPVSNVSPGASAPPIAGSDPEAQARIYQRARASGLDDEGARVLVAVSETEGGTRGAVGDNGQSRGVYQFHEKGEMPAFRRWVAQQGIEGDPNQLAVDPDVATRYAAEGYLGQAIARGRQLGYTGADLATYVQRTGQRSVDPARTGSNYERLFGQGAPPQQDSGDQAGQPGMSTAPTVAASQQQQEVAQSALDDPDKWALCGPVAAVNAAQAHGKTWTVAQAKQIAQQNKLWDAGTGMYGLESQVKLLNQMGVSSRTGAADPTALAKDAQSGNTPIISTPKHYFLLKGYNPQTGEFDTGASGTVLRGGKRWMTLAEISNAGGGIQGAAYMDNPTTPAPSTVAPAAPTAAPPQAAGSPAPVAAPPPAAAGASDMVTIQQIDSGRQITVPTASLPGYMQSPAPGVPAMWRVVDGGGQADMRKLSLDGDPPQPMPGSQGPYDQSPPSLPGATLLPDESSVGPSPDGQTWIDRRNERSMYRQPLGGPPVRDRWADDPSQQPYDPDQGPRESGYTLPSADVNAPSAPNTALNTAPNALHAPAPTYNDPTTTGTQHQPIVASPTTYGDSGDFLPMPAWAQEPSDPTISDPNYTQPAGLRYDPNDPSTGVNPLAPGSLRPTDIPPEMQGARPWLPATTPAGGITPPPGVLDSIVPRAAQTGPLFEGPTAPTRWSPEFQAQYGQGGEAAPFQDDQREPGYRPTPSPRTLSPYQPGSANALVGVPTAPSDQEILAGQGPIARRIDAIDREQRDQSPGYAAGSAMLTPDSLITPENRQTFMQNAPGSTPSSLVAWHDRITAGGADALAAGLGQDPDRAVVAVTIGGMPVRMTVSDLLENVTDPAFGAGFSVGDVVLDAVGQRALHIVAPYVKGAARAVVNRLAGEVRSLPEIVARGARAVGEGLAPTPGRAASDAPGVQMLGAGMVPSGSTLRNAAQGAVVGAASEDLQAQQEGRDPDPTSRLVRGAVGAGLGIAAGSSTVRSGVRDVYGAAARNLGSGFVGRPASEAASAAPNPVMQRMARQMAGDYTPTGVANRRGLSERWAQAWTDDRAGIRTFQEAVSKAIGRPLTAGESVAELTRVNPASVASQRLDDALRPALQAVGEDEDYLAQYLVHAHNEDVARAIGRRAYDDAITAGKSVQDATAAAAQAANTRQFSGDLRLADTTQALQDIQQRVTSLPDGAARWQAIKDGAQAVWDTNRQTLERKRDAGIISDDLYNELTSRYPRYVRTDIADYFDKGTGGPAPAGKRIGVSDIGIQKISDAGTTKERVNPLLSTIDQTYSAESSIARNEAGKAFEELVRLDPSWQSTFKEVVPAQGVNRGNPATTVPSSYSLRNGEQFLKVWDGGQARTYVIPKEYAALVSPQTGRVLGDSGAAKALTTAMNVYKSLITSKNPAFSLVVSPIRDLGDYATREGALSARSKGPLGVAQGVAGAVGALGDYARAVPDAFAGILEGTYKGDLARMMREGAGQISRPGRDQGELRTALHDLQRTNGLEVRSAGDLAHLVGNILTLGAEPVGNRIEQIPRLAASRRAQRRGASDLGQAMAFRDATVDFQRAGEWSRAANSIIPFFNVAMQSGAQTARTFKANPAAFMGAVAASVGTMAMAAEAWNRADDQRAADYEDVPDYLKKTGVVFMLPGVEGRAERGDRLPNYVWVPVGQYGSLVQTAKQTAADYVAGKSTADLSSPSGWGQLGAEVAGIFSPIRGDSAGSVLSSITPPGLSTGLELAANKDLFRGSTIATDRKDEQASALSQGSASAYNAATGQETRPSQWEYAYRDLGGYGSTLALEGSNLLAERLGMRQPKDEDRPIQNAPVVGGLVNRVVRDAGGQQMEEATVDAVRVPEGMRAAMAEAGLRRDEIPPVPSTLQQIPLTRAEQTEWQQRTNAYIENAVDRMTRSPEYRRRGADQGQLIKDAIATARERAGAEVLRTIPQAERTQRIRASRERKAS